MGFFVSGVRLSWSGVVWKCPDLGAIWSHFGHSFSRPKMIDWISCRLPCENAGEINGGQVISITADGEIEWESQKRLSVPGCHESSIAVRSYGAGVIEFDGNPAKWLQGHNCFGTDDLIGLVYESMVRIVQLLKLNPSPSDIQTWLSGDYDLTRVDCTAMWELPTRADVRAVIRALELQAKSRHLTSRCGKCSALASEMTANG
jgi:II/X family phage/plasmid replication protein